MIAKCTLSHGPLSPRALFVSVTALVALISLAGCGAGSSATTSGTASTATSAPTATTAPPTATAGVPANATTIKITGAPGTYTFQPASVTIKAGSTVVWVNDSGVVHTSTSDTGDAVTWDSSVISTGGGSFSFVFTKPGTYPYHCSFHSFMHGTIVVTG